MKKIYLPIVLFFYVHVAIADSQRQLDSLQTRMSYLKKQRTIDSLHTSLKNEKQEIEIVNTLLELASIFRDGSPDSAMVFGNDAYQLAEKVNYQMGIGRAFHLIATIFGMKEDNNNALLYFSKALAVYDKMDNDTQKYPHEKVQAQKAKSLANIGMVYKAMKNYDKALDYFFIAHKIEEEIRNKAGVARNLGNIGDVYCDKQDYNKAFEYELRGLDIYKKLADKNGIATITGFIGRIYVAIKEYPKAEKYLLEARQLDDETRDYYGVMNMNESLSSLYAEMKDYNKALEFYKKAMDVKFALFNEKMDKEIISKTLNFEFEKKDAIAKKELERQKIVRNGFIIGTVIFLVLAVIIFISLRKTAAAKRKSDELLLNILPEAAALELKKTGHCAPKTFSMVTVMLADIKDFTKISEKVSAELLVNELNYCFSAFDDIMERHHIEKIKTVGDAYMCAGGLPTLNYTHAFDMLSAAIEIKDFILNRKKEKIAKGEMAFEIRIGIHTGPVVAGIVGTNKFSYDIWGDTVNIAARMEQSCQPGHINISHTTYDLVKDKFDCIHRGKVHAKNKGEIDMYFVS